MLGTLSEKQCEYILTSYKVGRIGCYANKKVYIVPITYVYDDKHVYASSLDGMKIDMMRKNADVCFQVDVIDDLANWRSVVAWGKFEEIKSPDLLRDAGNLFLERLLPITTGETVHPGRELDSPPLQVQKKKKPVAFRIKLREITGRFEKQVRH